MTKLVCIPRVLTPERADVALRRSLEINPANAAERREFAQSEIGRRGGPRRLVVAVGYKWPASGVRLSVQFLDNPSKALRKRILAHMNAWSPRANARFDETGGVGEVRIARLDRPSDMAGYWSYVGTQILDIPQDEPTLNLEGFTLRTSDAEFRRVVRHEAGHTLGFEHEHMRSELIRKIDRRKAFAYFDRTQGWDRAETIAQVLSPLAKSSILGTTEADPLSIMCYQIPGEITKDGEPIPGGVDITPKDFEFAAKLYPRPQQGDPTPQPAVFVPPNLVAGDFAVLATPERETFQLLVLDPFDSGASEASKTSILPLQEDGSSRPARRKPNFLRVFASYGGARAHFAMQIRRLQGGSPTRFGRIIATHERIKHYTNRDSGTLPDEARLIAFGGDLFEALFGGDVRRLYDEARARQQGRKLDLVLTSMVPWIAEKPWEFAYDTTRSSFLATEDIHFVRNVVTNIPADHLPPQSGPLRILVAAAQPIGFGRLSIAQETEVIRRGFEALIEAGLAVIEVLPRATPSDIHAALLRGRFQVVHFIGHGAFDEETRKGSLAFEDARGNESSLGQRSVREIFCKRGVKLVFLNACQSGTGSQADFNQGVAQSLVAHGLPALVANQYSVLDTSATHFAQHFYWSMAQGMTIGEAASEARVAVNYSLQGEIIDWAIPVVYARDPGMTLCASSTVRAALQAPPVRGRSRRTAPRPCEVAVWDIDNVFPALDAALGRMQRAQAQFGFERVDLSTPIDAWDLENKSEDGTPYLWAEKLAHRLGRTPMELHVDVLACITRHWMRDDDWLNIYGWWPDEGGAPVVIFSFAGFDDLPAAGDETDRVVANLLVTALAGYFGRLGTHDTGAKDCPMSRNGNRSLRYLTQAHRFDRGCRAALLARIPTELRALEAICNAFR